MRVFILEDDPARMLRFREALIQHEVTHGVDVADALAKFEPPYDLILFDHDLGGEQMVPSTYKLKNSDVEAITENTGYQFAKRISARIAPETHCIVHSYNPDGATAIVKTLRDAGLKATRAPFSPSLLAFLAR